MKNREHHFRLFFLSCVILLTSGSTLCKAQEDVKLYTPYTKIAVPPGETVDYSVELKNTGKETKNIDIYLSGLPRTWDYSLKAGGYTIKQISVQAGDSKAVSLKINVPMRVSKGDHQFKLIAGNSAEINLVINVSEQGTFKTEYTSDQINLQGHAKSDFKFSTKLKNQTGEVQVYSLHASPPQGWNVVFKPNYKQATAVEIQANSTSNIEVDIVPPFNIKAGTYKIPVEASNRSTSATLDLEIVITGSYEMDFTTPTGLLSSKITAGDEKRIEMLVVNTGSSELKNIVFRSSKPKNWDVTFEPDTILHLNAGEKTPVFAKIKAYEKAIPGDYIANLSAQTKEVSSKVAFRISVKTSLLWGWVGIIIVLATLGVILFLFRKFGRR